MNKHSFNLISNEFIKIVCRKWSEKKKHQTRMHSCEKFMIATIINTITAYMLIP